MNAKLNAKLNTKLNAKSLTCWFLLAATCPQLLAIASVQSQNIDQLSANPVDPAAIAVASRITEINANVSSDRLNLVLNFASSDRPQVTYTRQGKAWIALLNGAQLQLSNGNASYAMANPAPGITAIEATQYATNKVRIRVTAADADSLKDQFKRQDSTNGFVLSMALPSGNDQAGSIAASDSPETGIVNSQTVANAASERVLIAQNTTPNVAAKPLFEPKVTITSPDGKVRTAQANDPNSVPPPVANPVTPQLPGRVPGVVPPFRQLRTPPVGDIATSTASLRPDIIDLGTAERVPRITLRNAPAIEVLTLIGRVAGLSVVSLKDELPPGTVPTVTAPGQASTDPTLFTGINKPVSLAVENETAQDVFNNVLRITGLEANRIGQTIFVATKLPVTLKNIVTKNYRLNQISVGQASAFLAGLGASRVISRQRLIPGVQTATIGTSTTTSDSVGNNNNTTESVPTLETIPIPPESTISPLLKGLQVVAEERSNSLTLIGSPSQVAYAEAQLARLDLRKRQVNVNVKVVEISLDNRQTVSGGVGFLGGNPSISETANQVIGISLDSGQPITLPTRLLANIRAFIENGSGKVLTDPNLTVQEGETATVALTQEVPGGFTVDVTRDPITQQITSRDRTPIIRQAGLTLNVNVERVDDNGFVNMSISPTVSAITNSIDFGDEGIVTYLANRTLNSGRIRLRDGQTFILSGVIQDSDRETVSKIPILGDLPIIGALFRSQTTNNIRNEVIIIVTPRIMDDSQNANWGYTYQPGPEVQKVLDSNQIKPQ